MAIQNVQLVDNVSGDVLYPETSGGQVKMANGNTAEQEISNTKTEVSQLGQEIIAERTAVTRFIVKSSSIFINKSEIGYSRNNILCFKIPVGQISLLPNQFIAYSNDGATIASYSSVVTVIDTENGVCIATVGSNFQYFVFLNNSVGIDVTILSEKYVDGILEGSNSINMLFSDVPKIEYSVNLYDKSRAINGKYITTTGYETQSSYKVTHPILFKKNVTYKWPHGNGLMSVALIALVDKDANIVTVVVGNLENGFESITLEQDSFVCLNIGNGGDSSFMVSVANEYPNTYVPYKESLDKYVNTPSNINPLEGKIIAFDGDSICYGEGYAGGYGHIISDRNNMTYENIAVGGATLATGTYWDEQHTDARHWICASVLNLRSDADYIIIEGGCNDSEPVGTFSNNYDGVFDSTTMYGAVDTLCKNLLDRFPGKKIGFIISHGVTDTWSAEGTRHGIVVKVLNKWGIPCLDLTKEVPPFKLLPSNNYLRTTYTKDGDGYHPNEEGYKKYYCDKIEAWLKTL